MATTGIQLVKVNERKEIIMREEDLSIFEYRMTKEIKYTDIIKNEHINGKSEKISYFIENCGYIDGYIYRPKNSDNINLPVIFNFHGGGMVLRYCEQDAKYCQMIADELHVAVVNVDYPVAPEYKYPLPIVFSYNFIVKVKENAKQYRLDADNIAVMGHSAGGYISAALCIVDSEKNKIKFKGLIADYAVLRQDKSPELRKAIDSAKAIPVSRMTQYYNWYFNIDDDSSEWLASPCNAPGNIFPPSFILSAEYDSLAEEEFEFYKNLEASGVDVTYKKYLGCRHGFTHDCFDEFNEQQANIAWNDMEKFLSKVLRLEE